jgi:hypothetical protein
MLNDNRLVILPTEEPILTTPLLLLKDPSTCLHFRAESEIQRLNILPLIALLALRENN